MMQNIQKRRKAAFNLIYLFRWEVGNESEANWAKINSSERIIRDKISNIKYKQKCTGSKNLSFTTGFVLIRLSAQKMYLKNFKTIVKLGIGNFLILIHMSQQKNYVITSDLTLNIQIKFCSQNFTH
jgi:hypothetical protein